MTFPKIVTDERVPPNEAWLIESAGYDVQRTESSIILTRYDRIVGKIVGLVAHDPR